MSPTQYLVNRILFLEDIERKYSQVSSKISSLTQDNRLFKTKISEQEAYIKQLEESLKQLSAHVIKLRGDSNEAN